MNIQVPHIPNYNLIRQTEKSQQIGTGVQLSGNDVFVLSLSEKNNEIAFKGGFFKNLFAKRAVSSEEQEDPSLSSDFAKQIAAGVKEYMSDVGPCNIKPSCFNNIVSPSELREILPNFKQENFKFINEPIDEKEEYCIDLDYQSNFSSGIESVYRILERAAEYSEKYYSKTGKNFVFALADRDSLEGLQAAVAYMGKNPERFKHLKFIPAIKLSFSHEAPKSDLKYENSEILVYGINPYSKNIIDFVDDTIKRRKEMLAGFIGEISKLYPDFDYNYAEFLDMNGIKGKKDFYVSNLYWRACEYAQKKANMVMGQSNYDHQSITDDASLIMTELFKPSIDETNVPTSRVIRSLSSYRNSQIEDGIHSVFAKYITHYDKEKGKLVSPAENLYDDIIECFSREPDKPVMALASPYYYMHHFNDENAVCDFIEQLKQKSNGMLCAFESLAPFYNLDSELIHNRQLVEKFNNVIRNKFSNTDFYEVGGSFAKVKVY